MRRAPLLLLAASVLMAPAIVSAQDCTGPDVVRHPYDLVEQRIEAGWVNKSVDSPQTASQDKQIAAPTASGTSTTLANGASFPELLGLAMNNNPASSTNGALTIDLNLFGFKAMTDPDVLDRQSRYKQYEEHAPLGRHALLRRQRRIPRFQRRWHC